MDYSTFYKIGQILAQEGNIVLDDDGNFDLIDQSEAIKDQALKLFVSMADSSLIADTWADLDSDNVKLILLKGFINPETGFEDLLNELYLEFETALSDGLAEVIPGIAEEQFKSAKADAIYETHREDAA